MPKDVIIGSLASIGYSRFNRPSMVNPGASRDNLSCNLLSNPL
jgi:hypothetical protein